MLSRRGFLRLGAAGAAMAADWRLWAAAEGLPAYYGGHLARVAARIKSLAKECDGGFFFITDLHIPSNRRMSGRIIARLIADTGLKCVLCGGDMPGAFGTKASLDDSIAAYRSEWVETIERAGGEFYPAKGNHDFTIRASAKEKDGFTYPGTFARDVLMDTAAVKKRAVTNPDDPEACCYYVDFPESRLRLIVADTTDSVNPARAYWAVTFGMRERQLRWLAEKAFAGIPDGWAAIALHHVPVAEIVTLNRKNLETYVPWRSLLEAYANRGRAKIGTREYDFAGAKATLLCSLTGHVHAERQTFRNGLWHLTQPFDAAGKDYIAGSAPWCANLPEKKRGTVFEQTFDAVQFDLTRRLMHFTRIGGGGDRTVHLAPRTVKVGETMKFTAECLSGKAKWGCYDADRAQSIPSPENRYIRHVGYFNDVADISPDGVLTAKKAGKAVVLAIAPDGAKEIFAADCTTDMRKGIT